MNFLHNLRSPSPSVAATVNDPAHPSHLHNEPFASNESLARRSLLLHHEATRKEAEMLLLHTSGSVKIGEILRYKVTYFPSRDRILPLPTSLHLRIKNTEVMPLRAAYLHGPFVLYCSVKSERYSHWSPIENPREEGGYPEFEPNLRAGSTWGCELPVPATMRKEVMARERERRSKPAHKIGDRVEGFGHEEESITWIVEVISQMIFSSTAKIAFDLAVARDEKSLSHYGTGFEQGSFSNAIEYSVMNTNDIWNLPPFPREVENKTLVSGENGVKNEEMKNKGPKKVHLVLITHGIHSNCGADMLFVKESIDRTTKELREARKAKRRHEKKPAEVDGVSTGDVEHVDDEDSDDDEEQIITRGFHGNVCRTERGIKYLGKRLARYAFALAYPDRPLPASLRGHRPTGLWRSSTNDLHEPTEKAEYQVTSISFIGHSLGGLVQTYAIAYIHAHDPDFFQHIQPVNFVALATPFLGLSNENPIYVKFALDFGLVGRTGQDLGLTWRAPNMATSAMSGFSLMPSSASVKSEESQAPGAKPLLRILPMGPAKEVLKMFRNRTVYANVVNDGVVPLRTSCLLFLDWKGLGRVEKARRANEGPIGQVSGLVGWGLGQLTSGTSTPRRSWHRRSSFDESTLAESESDRSNVGEAPLTKGPVQRRYSNSQELAPASKPEHPAPSALSSFWTFFKPHAGARHDRKMQKILSRSQVTSSSSDNLPSQTSTPSSTSLQPVITEDLVDSPTVMSPAPSSTTLAGSVSSDNSSSTVTATNSSKTGDATSTVPTDDPTITATGKATAAYDNPDAEQYEKMMAPPRTTLLEAAGDILNPPLPPLAFLINPETRPRTIFHDRVYHPSDIPPMPALTKKSQTAGRMSRSASYNSENGEFPTPSFHTANSHAPSASSKASSATLSAATNPTTTTKDGGHSPTFPRSPTGSIKSPTNTSGRNLKPEEKIARAFHDGVSWRKVLVRLEPDAHNNIIVRREFSNAYGWPVVKHLVETHFGDTVAARMRDDEEEGDERALDVDTPTTSIPNGEASGWKGGQREVEDALMVINDDRDGRSSGSVTPRRKERPMSPVWSDKGDCSSDSGEDDDVDEKKRREEGDDERRRMEVIDSFLGKVLTKGSSSAVKKGKKRVGHDETDTATSDVLAAGQTSSKGLGTATKLGLGFTASATSQPTLQARQSLERVREKAAKQKHE
ncbi:hypothetical protein ABW20_dc0104759 [Dactylellina cionopaga]|nr:hypothetical protein ABW20_dc0104759 [Dactylellina cionopaga]